MRYLYLPLSTLPLTLVFAHAASAAKCAAPALAIPYRATAILPGVLTHGLSVQFGSPPQHIALTPSLQLDSTFVPRLTASCVRKPPPETNATQTQTQSARRKRDGLPGRFQEDRGKGANWTGLDWRVKCAEVYGGGFNPALSTTFRDVNGVTEEQGAEPWLRDIGFNDWGFATEEFAFTEYLDVYTRTTGAVPEPGKRNLTTRFVVPDEGAVFGGLGSSALGLTPQSTLVQALYEAEIVASTSWSLTGSALCLGCVDDGAHVGAFQTFKPADRSKDAKLPCLIQARVVALNWHSSKESEGATLIEKPFMACIDPGVELLVLPEDARKAFQGMVDREVKAEYDDYVVFKGPPKEDVGIFTFKLDGGLEVNATMPGAGKTGAEEKGEWRVPIGNGRWGAYGSEVWTLGKPFTDHVVLRWDSEAKEYGIADLNEGPDRKEDIKPLGCDKFPIVEKSITTTPGTGIIIGSVIGGFLGGFLFASAAWWFYKRGVKGGKTKYHSMPSEEMLPLGRLPGDRRTMESMMSGALSPPSTASARHSLRSQFSSSVPTMEPQLVEDNSIFEAPEGGTTQEGYQVHPELRYSSGDLAAQR